MSGSMFDDTAFRGGAEKGVHSTDTLNGADLDEPPIDADDHHAGEWTNRVDEQHGSADEPTTWEPIDLGPYLRGEVDRPQPSVGMVRTDGLRLLYPGREHAVVGATESGKTWFALGSAAAEIAAGHRVIYVHFEEPDPGSTVERLLLLGATTDEILERLRFIAPTRAVRAGWMDSLLSGRPALVVLDGINEGMAVHASGMDTDGWSAFRRWVITPCIKAGATVLSCDHIPMGADGSRINAYGTVHKGNTLDGARIHLENAHPFGRGMRGVSHVFVTKDRPGHLRIHGKQTKVPGKTYAGTLAVDDATLGPDFVMRFYAPNNDEKAPESDPAAELAAAVHAVIAALPDRTVESTRMLCAALRKDGHQVRDDSVRDAVAGLLLDGLLTEAPGKRGAKGYRAVLTASQESPTTSASATASATASPLRGGRGTQSRDDRVGRSGTQSDAVGRSESGGPLECLDRAAVPRPPAPDSRP